MQYRFEGTNGDLQDWSTTPTFSASPNATTVYTVSVRCSTNLPCTDATTITVEVDALPPSDIELTLRAVDKTFISVTFDWSTAPPLGADEHYHVYRATVPVCDLTIAGLELISDPGGPPHTFTDTNFTDGLALEPLYFYEVRVADQCENISFDPYPPDAPCP